MIESVSTALWKRQHLTILSLNSDTDTVMTGGQLGTLPAGHDCADVALNLTLNCIAVN